MTNNQQTNDLTRRKFLKWTAGGVIGAGALTLGLKPWKTKTARGVTLSETRPAMGTFVEITARGEDEKLVNNLIDRAYEKIKNVDESMSVFKDNSRVYRLNLEGNRKVDLTPEMVEVLDYAQQISNLTDGSFDVTSAPLMKLWGFYDDELTVPTDEELTDTLELVNYENLTVDKRGAKATLADEKAGIDLGGIAKGYGVDKAVEVLKEGGASAGLVNAGGDIRGYGNPEGDRPWKVGLQHPFSDNDILTALNLILPAVTTSGNYESFFTYNGSKLSHIIDPKTGRPVEDTISVSVLTDEAIKADGLSTGAFSQTPEEALRTVSELDDAELIYIGRDASGKIEVTVSDGLTGEVDGGRLERSLNSVG